MKSVWLFAAIALCGIVASVALTQKCSPADSVDGLHAGQIVTVCR